LPRLWSKCYKINNGRLAGGAEQLTRYLELLDRDPPLASVQRVLAAQEIRFLATATCRISSGDRWEHVRVERALQDLPVIRRSMGDRAAGLDA
jgi:hypothetical protein